MGRSPITSPIPQYYSYTQVRKTSLQMNDLFLKYEKLLKICLVSHPSKLVYNNRDWRKSVIPGTIIAYLINGKQKHQSIVLSIEIIYKIGQMLRNLTGKQQRTSKKQERQMKKDVTQIIRRYSLKSNSSGEKSNITPQIQECCLCLDKIPTCALPCSHVFCEDCVTKYIVQRDEKKCPKCRTIFQGTSDKVAKQVYTVIQQEQQIFDEVRETILGLLSEDNNRAIKKLYLQEEEKENKYQNIQELQEQ